jgi:hypothetical protein
MNGKRFALMAAHLAVGVLLIVPVSGAAQHRHACQPVSGVLTTNINVVDDLYNVGPVFGDLAGVVAAKVLSGGATFTIQHYWITSSGETILFKPAILTPTFPTGDQAVVAVPWGNYRSEIKPGGTGKYKNATGYLDYFGMADFKENTLVLRYRGQVCYPDK